MADHLLLLLCTIPFATHLATATDHIVGANRGWNPGFNYTLWANNQTFYVNDFICNYKLPPPTIALYYMLARSDSYDIVISITTSF